MTSRISEPGTRRPALVSAALRWATYAVIVAVAVVAGYLVGAGHDDCAPDDDSCYVADLAPALATVALALAVLGCVAYEVVRLARRRSR